MGGFSDFNGLSEIISGYAKKNPVRFHMPGHKGRPEYALDYALDVTELFFTDNLYDPSPEVNLINSLEDRIARCFFGAKSAGVRSFISCSGATLCIQGATLALIELHRRRFNIHSTDLYMICDRASHVSLVNAMYLLGVKPLWVYPGENFPEKIDYFAQARKNNNIGVFVTSPDYYGAIKDIKEIAKTCKKNSLPLAVDNSHGSHLAFYKNGAMHPINLGADISVDSIHKTLPALTGAAVLHADKKNIGGVRQYINTFASTSPSYLILQSIEKTVDLLEGRGIDEHARLLGDINLFKNQAGALGFGFDADINKLYDPYRIVLSCENSGEKLYYHLAGQNIFCEFFTKDRVVAIPSISNCAEDFHRLYDGLKLFAQNNKIKPATSREPGYPPGVPGE